VHVRIATAARASMIAAGFETLLASGGTVLLEQSRIEQAQEFVNAVGNPSTASFGVLLSGPTGVGEISCAVQAARSVAMTPCTHALDHVDACAAGKSGIGLLAFLLCLALGLPVVYITRAGDWVTAAMDGWGDFFFLRTLLEQNAGEMVV